MISTCRDLNELHPKVKELAEKLVEECEKQGIKIKISETYRTKERQDYLYAQGRTRPGNIVTYVTGSAMRSYHQWRLAFDIYHDVKGDEYNSKILKAVGAIGTKLGLEWGGSWSGFQDTPHFQYTFGLSIQDLKNGKQPPVIIPKTINTAEDFQKQYEDAIDRLVQVGVINTKHVWIPDPNVKYTKFMILKLGSIILNEKDYDKIIELFVKNNTVSQIDIWKKGTYSEKDVKYLVQKIVKYL